MNNLYKEYPKTKKYKEFKMCNSCKQTYHFTDFYISKSKGTDNYIRLEHTCKKCSNERSKRNKYKNVYGSTVEHINSLFIASNGKCQICKKELTLPGQKANKDKVMHIDHDHSTGVARGILCHHCNVGLGAFKDDLKLLQNAINYLNVS